MTSKLSRRFVLKGLGGITLGLPLLEAMLDQHGAYAAGAALPTRYLVAFCGQSLGGDGDPLGNLYVPNTVGAGYDLKTALAPLKDVQSEVSVVSGLAIPTANGGAVPAAGRPDNHHVTSLSPLLSGTRSDTNTVANGPTSDQVVGSAIGATTAFKTLTYRVQAEWYLSVGAPYGRDAMSYKKDASGRTVVVPPTVSPKAAFDALFGSFMGPSNTGNAAILKAQTTRKSILDFVAGRTQKLIPTLGKADQLRMQRHLDEIRDLEKRIAMIPPPQTSVCIKPGDPGSDPSLGGSNSVNGGTGFDTSVGYSGEEQRARVFCDLIHMAFTCDLARSASLMFSMFQSHMNMYALTGHRCDLHEIGHGGDSSPGMGGTLGVSKGIAWHVKHFAYLVQKFRDTPEGAGKMLDNMAMVFVNEGGHGFDPSSGKGNSSHSTENMAALIAGRAGGLRPGKHVAAPGKHPANVLISAMNAVGVPGGLGEVSGSLPGLFA